MTGMSISAQLYKSCRGHQWRGPAHVTHLAPPLGVGPPGARTTDPKSVGQWLNTQASRHAKDIKLLLHSPLHICECWRKVTSTFQAQGQGNWRISSALAQTLGVSCLRFQGAYR